ncbi:Thiol-disulfide isomerase or thioredoxin [Pricia antarctica]|uniref:Thiol-disulfide isomerase or thioredoxin n=2 Tax=Pricia antarctica TaxID=641691 RepID=A0A1G6Y487_9FLAO|nr:Thiol-disulfide isomerase or thioredoxin [Pricia antarctica]
MHSMEKTTETLVQEGLLKAISYGDYRKKVSQLAADGKSTGPEQTEDLANYTQLNDRRMKRFDKTLKIDSEFVSKIESISEKITLLVLTESWCGDAAPTLPVMNKIAEINGSIDFKILLRDENPALMNRFLTNGAMSIPKLILLDDNNRVFGAWGPIPQRAAQLVREHKEKHGELLPEIKEEIQHWYNKDKGSSTLQEVVALLPVQ